MKIIYCFVIICTLLSSAVSAQNLLTNPGFEDGLSSWDTGAWGGAVANYSVSSDIKQTGEKSAKIEITAAYPDDAGRAYIRKNGLQLEQDIPHVLDFHLLSNSGKTESIVVSLYSHTNIGGNAWVNGKI